MTYRLMQFKLCYDFIVLDLKIDFNMQKVHMCEFYFWKQIGYLKISEGFRLSVIFRKLNLTIAKLYIIKYNLLFKRFIWHKPVNCTQQVHHTPHWRGFSPKRIQIDYAFDRCQMPVSCYTLLEIPQNENQVDYVLNGSTYVHFLTLVQPWINMNSSLSRLSYTRWQRGLSSITNVWMFM